MADSLAPESENPAETKRKALTELIPEAFSEGRLSATACARWATRAAGCGRSK